MGAALMTDYLTVKAALVDAEQKAAAFETLSDTSGTESFLLGDHMPGATLDMSLYLQYKHLRECLYPQTRARSPLPTTLTSLEQKPVGLCNIRTRPEKVALTSQIASLNFASDSIVTNIHTDVNKSRAYPRGIACENTSGFPRAPIAALRETVGSTDESSADPAATTMQTIAGRKGAGIPTAAPRAPTTSAARTSGVGAARQGTITMTAANPGKIETGVAASTARWHASPATKTT
ncbi:uncharacterized protein KY384_004673 [Bacidia gigantensis]|uniref:uncharacterized protein n=1 Tax=Bacidia gigantensis TaxID=2732470 RepID=UPI001D04414D|nr:uncharacterized protein KY384_004673 [Bacidia gigantensis]KAG8530635.1 hypothetical protein KY384_004673 [Bacidia gigantensis]